MSIKEGDMVSIRQDFIDEYHKHEYNSKDIWEVKEVCNIGGGYYVAIINNLTGYGDARICTYNLNLMTLHDLKMRENEINRDKAAKMFACERYLYDNGILSTKEHNDILNRLTDFVKDYDVDIQLEEIPKVKITI